MRLLPGGRATVTNAPLRRVDLTAYGMLPQQLIGGPAWLETSASTSWRRHRRISRHPRQEVLGACAADAAASAIRSDSTWYTPRRVNCRLRAGRGQGRRTSRAANVTIEHDCAARLESYGRGEAPMPPTSECGGSREPGRLWMRGASMPTLARSILTGWTDRVVDDRTGLSGGYDLDLEFTPGSGTAAGTSAQAGDSVSLFTALEEQLGLKLQATRSRIHGSGHRSPRATDGELT